MAILYIFYITSLNDSSSIGKIGALCRKEELYFEKLKENQLTNAFSYFSQYTDFLIKKETIFINDFIYQHIKSVNDNRKKPKLLFKNNNYIIQIDDYIVTITSFDFMDSDEFIFDRIGVY